MKYFFLDTDERNKIPYDINKNCAIDIPKLAREGLSKLSGWTIVRMVFPHEGFFPDILCKPCLFLSQTCMEVLMMYGADVSYKVVKLSDWENGANATYFLPIIEEVDCMSKKTTYNTTGNRIEELVLEEEKIGNRVAFKVKGYERKGFMARLDYVESILRRMVRGIRLEEVCVV